MDVLSIVENGQLHLKRKLMILRITEGSYVCNVVFMTKFIN
jgi:hypothetical protein